MGEEKKYYWLKLKRDFFKRHDIRIVEKTPNGKDYILFYLKLLCESVDHDGYLRFSEQIPYDENMLATITDTNIDIVRSAIKIFSQLKMMEILDDGTYYMNEVNKMLGTETYWAEKKRIQRAKEEVKLIEDNVQDVSNECPTCPSKSKSKIKSKSNINIGDTEINFDEEFDILWNLYPNKKGKNDSYKKYVNYRKTKDSNFEIVKQGILNYVEYIKLNKISKQYIKHGSTYFNQKSWEDELDLTKPTYNISNNVKQEKQLPNWYKDYEKGLNEVKNEAPNEEMKKLTRDIFG